MSTIKTYDSIVDNRGLNVFPVVITVDRDNGTLSPGTFVRHVYVKDSLGIIISNTNDRAWRVLTVLWSQFNDPLSNIIIKQRTMNSKSRRLNVKWSSSMSMPSSVADHVIRFVK